MNPKPERPPARRQPRVALVTGAAHGVGRAIAAAFAAEGARVIVTDLDEAAGRAAALPLGAAWCRLDPSREMAWIHAVARVLDSHGRLDVLVNAAGIARGAGAPAVDLAGAHDPEHASLEDWRAVHQAHLDGVFLGCKHAIRVMRRQGTGAIVNVAPRATAAGAAGAASASVDAAVRRHTGTVARYCAAQGLAIRCNAIVPAAADDAVGRLAVRLASEDSIALTGVTFRAEGHGATET